MRWQLRSKIRDLVREARQLPAKISDLDRQLLLAAPKYTHSPLFAEDLGAIRFALSNIAPRFLRTGYPQARSRGFALCGRAAKLSGMSRNGRAVPSAPAVVIARDEALASGLTPGIIRLRLRRGEWQRLHHGVYACFSGPVPRPLQMAGVLLAAGEGAALSHYTAAECAGLTSEPRHLIHVTVPTGRRPTPVAGAVVHRSVHIDARRHPTRLPPQTRIEETVLDLTDASRTVDDAIGWLAGACGKRLTTVAKLADAADARVRLRWRIPIAHSLREIDDGVHSLLEMKYRTDVEQAHRLPQGRRQDRHAGPAGAIYDDVRYLTWGVVVELDGRIAHPPEAAAHDRRRDNVAASRGDVVLHFGWGEVTTRPCEVAAQVAAAMEARGAIRPARPCRAGACAIRPG
jgi:very-short-patch-repair endonuclease